MKNPLLDVRFGAPEVEITAPKETLIPYPNIFKVDDSRESQIRTCQKRIADAALRFRSKALNVGTCIADSLRPVDHMEQALFQYFIEKHFYHKWRGMMYHVDKAKYPADIQPLIEGLLRDENDHLHGSTPPHIIELIAKEKINSHPLLQEIESVKQLKAVIARLTDDTKKQMLGYIGEETVIKPLSRVKLMSTLHEPGEIVRLAIKSSHDDLIISEFMKGCTSLILENPVSAFADPGGLLPRNNIAHPGEQISLSLENNSPDKEARVTAWVCYKPVFLGKGCDPPSAMSYYENLVRMKAIIGR